MTAAHTVVRLPAPAGEAFDVAIANEGGSSTVAVSGGLDGPSSLLLEDIFGWLCRDGRSQITVDVTGLTAVHSTAVPALSRAAEAAREAGGKLTLIGSSALARRLIGLTHHRPLPARAPLRVVRPRPSV